MVGAPVVVVPLWWGGSPELRFASYSEGGIGVASGGRRGGGHGDFLVSWRGGGYRDLEIWGESINVMRIPRELIVRLFVHRRLLFCLHCVARNISSAGHSGFLP